MKRDDGPRAGLYSRRRRGHGYLGTLAGPPRGDRFGVALAPRPFWNHFIFESVKTSSASRNRSSAAREGRARCCWYVGIAHTIVRFSRAIFPISTLINLAFSWDGDGVSWSFLEPWGEGSLQLLECATASCSQETLSLVESSLARAVALFV
jgi:hypothetical protein